MCSFLSRMENKYVRDRPIRNPSGVQYLEHVRTEVGTNDDIRRVRTVSTVR